MSSAQVALVIPTYERRQRVLRAVKSALDGTVVPAEIVVVDDGSTDGTADAIRELDHPRVRLVELKHNRGVAAARNAGIAASRHRWIALLDSDDVWRPDHLALLLSHLAEHPDCRIAQTRERWIRRGRRVNMRAVHRPRSGDIFRPSLARCLVSSSAVIFSRDLLEQVGGYDERLPACEDYDLWLRMARRAEFGVVAEEGVVKDGGRPDQLSRRIWGLDRFRVFSLVKLLVSGLGGERAEWTRATAIEKLAILRSGAERRRHERAVHAYDRWREIVASADPAPADWGPSLDWIAYCPILNDLRTLTPGCDPVIRVPGNAEIAV